MSARRQEVRARVPLDEQACSIARSEPLSARRKVLAIVRSLPDTSAIPQGGHVSLEVRGKRFAWFLVDHHGDGRIAVNCRVSDEMRARLMHETPRQAHVPKYLGHHGWIGMWLDGPYVPWALVRAMLVDAYRLTAPKSLAMELDDR